MFISSTFSQQGAPNPRCSYVVLHHGEERVLIPLQKDVSVHYEAVVRFAKEEWNLDGDELVLETKELNVCPGVLVGLRRECFAAGILNDIGNVFVARRTQAGRISNREGKRPENVGDHLKSADIEQPDFVVVGSKTDCGSGLGEDEDTMRGSEDKDENYVPKQLSSEPTKNRDEPLSLVPKPSGQNAARQPTNGGMDDCFTSSQTPSQNVDPVDADLERFVVCIHDGVEENSAAFRVAPDQTVLRVLKGACKHFKLDFTQSALYMAVNADGRVYRMKCEHSATMKSLNVQEYQEFVVGSML